jgi:hypothetical protein
MLGSASCRKLKTWELVFSLRIRHNSFVYCVVYCAAYAAQSVTLVDEPNFHVKNIIWSSAKTMATIAPPNFLTLTG